MAPFDLTLPEATPASTSPWDYFYPPTRPPRSLEAVKAKLNPTKKNPTDVYDPYAIQKKTPKWPFYYNRDQLVDVCTNYLMRHGKKARAEKMMQEMFLHILEKYPRKHPVTLFAEALDKAGPIFRNITTISIGLATITPTPLTEKQRIKKAFLSMTKPAGKKSSSYPFSASLADEVIKAYEGRSGGIQNRESEHKKAITNRHNVLRGRGSARSK
jgi:ribosomal protein S7